MKRIMSMLKTFGVLLLAVIIVPAPGTAQTPHSRAETTDAVKMAPDDVQWRVMPQFSDGRERALLFGNPEKGGDWVYRIRVPRPIRVEPHTHPVDEYITVLEGNWSFGIGRVFDSSKLVVFPPGSFVRVPANTPHFVATGEGTVVIQSSGSGVFTTAPAN
jgi:mannose-6-phosphate isomerase-like protein (cupin superfamily)